MAGTSSDDYPRPDFQRAKLQWQSLNGPWHFAFDDQDIGRDQRWYENSLPTRNRREIQVPFAFQTPASGVHETGVHEVLWYQRDIADIRSKQAEKNPERLLVRFGAVDYETTVWMNGQYVGNHRGGHVPFDIDVTDAVADSTNSKETQRLTVRVFDSSSDLTQPRGKQYWKPESESIFYKPTSGIWQSVWLEAVPSTRIGDGSYGTILQANDIQNGKLRARIALVNQNASQWYRVRLTARFEGFQVCKTELVDVAKDKTYADLTLDVRLPTAEQAKLAEPADPEDESEQPSSKGGVALWSPEHPLLYDIDICLYDKAENLLDEVDTTIGMRSIEWQKGDRTWHLNGKPYFQMLVLDQGYWPETGLTPPSPQALKKDIELSQALGFNGCRKHQKVEDPWFLYWADRLGYLVWGEMASAYAFDDKYVDRFNQEWLDMVRRDINHPCIVTWTPGNESWGYPDLRGNVTQRDHLRSLYYMTKTLDPTRPINDNCGWEHVSTDLTTFHDYSDGSELARVCQTWDGILAPKDGHDIFVAPLSHDSGALPNPGAPIICTEFGGVNIAPSKASVAKEWGYTTANDADDLLARIERLVRAIVDGGWCCGFVYTQLTDIEQETNGVYTPGRVAKLDSIRMRAILEKARQIYHEKRKESVQGKGA